MSSQYVYNCGERVVCFYSMCTIVVKGLYVFTVCVQVWGNGCMFLQYVYKCGETVVCFYSVTVYKCGGPVVCFHSMCTSVVDRLYVFTVCVQVW